LARFDLTALLESAGFVTGALSVWLAVRQNPWNWPFGVANAVCLFLVFLRARLYGDMALQVLFLAMCLLGWYRWLFGGEGHSRLRVTRITTSGALIYTATGVVATAIFTPYLRSVNDASPLLDALTTVLSVEAQYLMTRKVIEHWLVWMAADVIYIWLYAERGLYQTSVLYIVFLAMCVAGWRDWRRDMSAQRAAAA
jgi:nicotinamide mononucleotide transporter